MTLHIVSILYNAMPWIVRHVETFNRLKIDWTWQISEGKASNTNCTRWCKPQRAGNSNDGTLDVLADLKTCSNISVVSKQLWDGKIEMVNSCVERIKTPGVLLQIDADECWTVAQLETISVMFDAHPDMQSAMFWCRYFFGPNIVMTSRNCYGNNPKQDWRRAWNFKPGMRFRTHEPPVLGGAEGAFLTHDQTETAGLVFDHYGYAFRRQVEYKEKFYGYAGAVAGWEKLQKNKAWPVRLSDFLPWVESKESIACRLGDKP